MQESDTSTTCCGLREKRSWPSATRHRRNLRLQPARATAGLWVVMKTGRSSGESCANGCSNCGFKMDNSTSDEPMGSIKDQVLRVYPYAVCQQDTKPGTRRTGLYFVHIEPGGPVIAGGHTAADAWLWSLREMQKHELKPTR